MLKKIRIALTLFFLCSPVFATQINVNHLHWTPLNQDTIGLISAKKQSSGCTYGSLFNWLSKPLFFSSEDGGLAPIVNNQINVDLGFACQLRSIDFAVVAPVYVYQNGIEQGFLNLEPVTNNQGLGDMSLLIRYPLLQKNSFFLGTAGHVQLPTGNIPYAEHQYPSGRLLLLIQKDYSRLSFISNLGIKLQEKQTVINKSFASAVHIATGALLNKNVLKFGRPYLELNLDARGFSTEDMPVEIRSGVQLDINKRWSLNLGYGMGISSALVSPDQRYYFAIQRRSNAKVRGLMSPVASPVWLEGKTIKYQGGIHFHERQNTLAKSSALPIKEIATYLKNHAHITSVRIVVYTDNAMSSEQSFIQTNMIAKEIKQKMTDLGVNSERIYTMGMGSNMPIDSNMTDKGRENNRRVEFIILDMED